MYYLTGANEKFRTRPPPWYLPSVVYGETNGFHNLLRQSIPPKDSCSVLDCRPVILEGKHKCIDLTKGKKYIHVCQCVTELFVTDPKIIDEKDLTNKIIPKPNPPDKKRKEQPVMNQNSSLEIEPVCPDRKEASEPVYVPLKKKSKFCHFS